MSAEISMTALAIAFMVVLRSVAVRWTQRNAPGWVKFCLLIGRPMARSITVRVSTLHPHRGRVRPAHAG
jgi:hypothetical protein